jgi:C4-dicarboxylate transporter, DctQ subunit
MINAVKKLIDMGEVIAMVASMALVTIVITTQVILRYFFNDSITWAEEFTRFTIIWMSFIAASMGVRHGKHISVDILMTFTSPRIARILIIISGVLGIAFGLGILIFGGELFLHAMQRFQVSSAMQIPMYMVYAIFPISGTLLIYRYAEFLFNTITGGERLDEEKNESVGG